MDLFNLFVSGEKIYKQIKKKPSELTFEDYLLMMDPFFISEKDILSVQKHSGGSFISSAISSAASSGLGNALASGNASSIGSALSSAAPGLGSAASSAAPGLGNALSSAAPGLGNALSSAAPGLGSALSSGDASGIGNALSSAAPGLGSALSSGDASGIGNALSSAAPGLGSALSSGDASGLASSLGASAPGGLASALGAAASSSSDDDDDGKSSSKPKKGKMDYLKSLGSSKLSAEQIEEEKESPFIAQKDSPEYRDSLDELKKKFGKYLKYFIVAIIIGGAPVFIWFFISYFAFKRFRSTYKWMVNPL